MKVGDKLLCRVNLKGYSFHNSNANAYIFCFQDDFVKVVIVRDNSIQIENSKGKKMDIKETDYSLCFYNKKELRLKKLKELNDKL